MRLGIVGMDRRALFLAARGRFPLACRRGSDIMTAMPQRAIKEDRQVDNYYSQTRRPLPNLVVVGVLLLFYHVGAAFYGTEVLLQAPQFLGKLFYMLGAPAAFLPAIPILGVLFAQHLIHRDRWELHLHVIAGMIGEAILWTIPLIALSYVTARIEAGGGLGASGAARILLEATGAGVYEEFLFRMVLISMVLLLLVDVFGFKKESMTVLAVLAAGVFFSLCHFKNFQGGYYFSWRTMIFLTIAGILWGSMFLFRGFAIAVGSHLVWDVFALLATDKSS